MKKIILAVLILGVLYRLFISNDGNFIFNIDNARDMIDVREMVVLGNVRLIGSTTSIDGVFFGPLWYYMSAVPFALSGGNPLGAIIMEIILWAVGGYFLLVLVEKYYGKLALFCCSLIWFASNFILLGSQYAFNPNPVLFLTPVFIFSLLKYIETEKWWYSFFSWFLAGAFFHFVVPVGIFMPAVILLALFFIKRNLLKKASFWVGLIAFGLTFLPQLLFELRHNFFMTKNLLEYRSTSHGNLNLPIHLRAFSIFRSFYDTLLPTFMNFKLFTNLMIVIFVGATFFLIKLKKSPDKLTLICLLLIFVPLMGLIPLKVDVLRWYLNATIVSAIFLVGFIIYFLQKFKTGSGVAYILAILLAVFTIQNVLDYIQVAKRGDPGNSILKNEISAIDFVYQQAEGKNFKVYTYMPSVYDWPYQYLFWWHGQKNYGYLPKEYAYSPGKPEYVSNKKAFSPTPEELAKREDSELVFLIKEPDQIGQRHLWENQFRDLELLEINTIGSIIVEKRQGVI